MTHFHSCAHCKIFNYFIYIVLVLIKESVKSINVFPPKKDGLRRNSDKHFQIIVYARSTSRRQQSIETQKSKTHSRFTILQDMLTKETMLEESLDVKNLEMKKKMKAVDVFAEVIKYFIEDLVQSKTQQGTVFTNDDVHWVITVPAIWDLKAKQFMRDAAKQVVYSLVKCVWYRLTWS